MEQKEEDPPPFWVQNTAALRRADRHRRRRNQASNLFLNTGVLVVLLLAAAVVFLAIVIPSVLSLARQVFKPNLVKSSWNSLNLILVLFAIVCGFLGRKDDDQTPVNSPMIREIEAGNINNKSAEWLSPSPRHPWHEYHHQDSNHNRTMTMGYSSFGNVDTMRRLRRNTNSYPDLHRQDHGSNLIMNENRWRFYDDTHVDNNNHYQQFLRSDSRLSRSRSLGVLDFDDEDDDNDIHAKIIQVDDSGNRPAPPSQPSYSRQSWSPPSPISPTNYFWPPPSPPPPPPPPPQRACSSIAKKKRDNKRSNPTKQESTPPPPPPPPPPPRFLYQPMSPPSPQSPINYFWPSPSPPPPPPPPPPPRTYPSNLAKKKQENTRNIPSKRESRSKIQAQTPSPPQPQPILGNVSEDSKKKGIVIRTLNRFPKRKRRPSRRSYEDFSEFTEPQKVSSSIHRSKSNPEFQPSSPPPAPPPPPPPPPPSMFHNIFSKKVKTKKKVHSISTTAPPPPPPPPTRPLPKTRINPPAARRPAPPAKTNSFSSIDENTIGNCSESPRIPTPPPPPPPPPFKMPSWKYIMQGDYVKIGSNNNSPRSGYSASEDEESSPSNLKNTISPLSCPSPDVNSKADDFIARFRAKLTLEKMNSINRSHPSPLGSDSGRP